MPRPAKFDERQILDAAAGIVAAHGAPAATIGAIAQALGAPSGSIYHRFRSRDELLGRLWLDRIGRFQAGVQAALEHPDPDMAAINAALFTLAWVRADPAGARIALLHRREEFLGGGWPADMAAEAGRMGAAVEAGLATITRRLFGEDTPDLRRAAPTPLSAPTSPAPSRHLRASTPWSAPPSWPAWRRRARRGPQIGSKALNFLEKRWWT